MITECAFYCQRQQGSWVGFLFFYKLNKIIYKKAGIMLEYY